jgi:hypothetical protein
MVNKGDTNGMFRMPKSEGSFPVNHRAVEITWSLLSVKLEPDLCMKTKYTLKVHRNG